MYILIPLAFGVFYKFSLFDGTFFIWLKCLFIFLLVYGIISDRMGGRL